MNALNVTLAELATTRPGASRVFLARGIDFCCRGRRPLSEACEEKRLDPTEILREIESADPGVEDLSIWSSRPLAELASFIERRYHDRLRFELPDVIALAEKVERVHRDKTSCPRGLSEHLRGIRDEVMEHLEKEEQAVFPLIRDGRAAASSPLLHGLEDEHADLGRALEKTRSLTSDLTAPEEACTSWRALYLRLTDLEAELMEHIHLENNVLFPRALCES